MAYFALSRDNSALLNELNLTFPPVAFHAEGGDHRFDWQRGEFCAILVQQSQSHANANRRLIFGRDVFGRKSLCWRITTKARQQSTVRATEDGGDLCCPSRLMSDDDCAAGTFQLSVLPGRNSSENEGHDDGTIDAEWHEVPPGNIICLDLPPSSTEFKLFPNAKMPSTLRDFYFHLPAVGAFLSQTLRVHTYYYPYESISENALFKAFNGAAFTAAEGAQKILLGPSEPELLPVDTDQQQAATDQFVARFASALKGILVSAVPSIDCPDDTRDNLFEVPVLFSGGVDSLMVALMASEVISAILSANQQAVAHTHRWVIRLFSVAFGDKQKNNFSEASDRAQSIAAYEYLKSRSVEKYGFNAFSLVLVNVDREELIECRKKHIAAVIAPSKTVLDDSIGCVLWFASRMKGVDFDTGHEIVGRSPFALVGSGSDEQLGGYARHQTVFRSKGLRGLTEELSMEMHLIGARNFGRDDRIGTANGKSILAPFLEEPLVRWLNTLPTALKTGFGLANGTPNKFLLRNALRSMAVPEYFVQRPKRAMQFGTRMVKVEAAENGGSGTKLKGHQICEKLLMNAL